MGTYNQFNDNASDIQGAGTANYVPKDTIGAADLNRQIREQEVARLAGRAANQQGVDFGDETSMGGALLDPHSSAAGDYSFMGRDGMAAAWQKDYQNRGQAAQGRTAVQADMGQDNAVRAQQLGLANAYQQQVAGGGPSQVGFQASAGMNSAGALAANSRVASPMNMAASQRAGMLSAGGAAQGVADQAGQMRAQEIAQARGGLGGLSGAMRGADANAAFQQGGIDLRQRGLNDKMQAHGETMAQTIGGMQQQGQQGRAGQLIDLQGIASRRQIEREKIIQDKNNTNAAIGLGAASMGTGAFAGMAKTR